MSRPRHSSIAVFLLLPLLALTQGGCASGSTPSSEQQRTVPSRDQRLISPAEVREAMEQNVLTLYDLIRARRPQWLQQSPTYRATSGRQGYPVAVWMDRVRMGGVDQLRYIVLSSVESAAFLTPSEAQAQLGLDNLGGAIVVYSTAQHR